ncbi:MAG TPA: aminotransferase class I/II-fold pyridoxal phosphate-dependent enzyme [Thermoanaerobaculia bacterium]|nr:aminotransferase class I/II-fold pyridoxal phosphate-dependent enzyme [Thermoanaerobaculia bacterium]
MPKSLTMPQPAERTALLGFSDIVKIRNRVLALKQAGTPVLQLEGGEPFSPTPTFIKNAMMAALEADQTRYAPSSGVPSLVEAIREKLKVSNRILCDPSSIIVVAGGMHGLFCTFQAAVNPGDEVLFFSPYWTPINDLVTFSGGIPVRVPWEEVRAGSLEGSLRKRLTDKTRVIYVNSPSNPTGDVLQHSQLETIAQFAVENDLIVISDEAYEDFVYDGVHESIGSIPGMGDRTISVYTLSKSYSMTGWRIGYLTAPEPLMAVIRKLVLNSVNGVSTPTQMAAVAAFTDEKAHVDHMRSEYRMRRDLLLDALRNAGLDCPTPPGAFYLFVNVKERLGADSWKAMNEMLERTSIATVPGVVFGPEGEGHLRMSYSISTETLELVAAALMKL